MEIVGVENLTQDPPCSPPELHSCGDLPSSPFKEGRMAATFAQLNDEEFALAIVNDDFGDDAFQEDCHSDGVNWDDRDGEDNTSCSSDEDGSSDDDEGDENDGHSDDGEGNESKEVGGNVQRNPVELDGANSGDVLD
ncbi:hypothetical protein PR202_ga12754 [Eleusine coracana subsp. coracana]|uniref:Uncharacterized protein n=1 Tax=Eleusine coracana subsp. coracana TaxID=191504 RepID=A0AAV5CCG9_ELECO|nr:hypothetical protein PR202_ga12754 [Eleusine coracana subsp. coracana]